MLRLLTAAQAREADRRTIEELGVPGFTLMDHAARAVAERAARRANGGPIVVLAGPGNNGGDGWAAARHLIGWGQPVVVVSLASPDRLSGDAALAASTYIRTADALGVSGRGPPSFQVVDRATAVENLLEHVAPALVVDALFGTGLGRPLGGLPGEVVEILDEQPFPVLAVDLPSGLFADGQAPTGPCVRAIETVTFGGYKVAHFAEPGAAFCGEVVDVDISIVPPDDDGPRHLLIGHELVRDGSYRRVALAPVRAHRPGGAGDHKTRFGHVAVFEGAPATRGAARLAARSALRAGAGLVTLLADDDGPSPDADVMRRELAETIDAAALAGITALVVGPGLGAEARRHERARALLAAAAAAHVPVVVDAEALSIVKDGVAGLIGVLTPHPGEAARWLDTTGAEVQADRVRALDALVPAAGDALTVVLKGASPIIGGDGGERWHVLGRCGALAVAGSGDVLAGAIAAQLATGAAPAEAARIGVLAHQRAGRLLAARAPRGWLASELADALRDVLGHDDERGASA
jgi:hydroxyethylthiazole kinase-like uncharacterized protein yjeF